MSVTFHDQFCGAGGLTLGAVRAGAVPVLGMNHSPVACTTYEHNHAPHGAAVACVDVCTLDPRRIPPARLFLGGPSCTHHSYARGRPKDDPSLFDPTGDKEAERSRATMWDVPRFAEHHDYDALVVENVEQAVKWGLPKGKRLKHGEYGPLFAAWLNVMEALGYRFRLVHLNAMVVGVPQSRDRLFVVLWKKGMRAPDLDIPAFGYCPTCERLVYGAQRWKREGATTGAYGPQYFYACGGCQSAIFLAINPAASAIDWTLPAPRIGDRSRPLAPATMARIGRGLEKLRRRPFVIPITHVDGSDRSRSVDRPLRTITGSREQALVVQVGGHTFEREGYARAWPVEEPLKTIHGTLDRALVVSNMANNVPRLAVDEVMATVTTGDKLYLLEPPAAAIIPSRKNTIPRAVDGEALPTICGRGTHHGLLIANYGGADGPDNKRGWSRHVDDGPLGTVTTKDHHALFVYRGEGDARRIDEPAPTIATVEQQALLSNADAIDVEDCGFRMLKPDELKRGQDFDADYVIYGNQEQQVMQIGNAVAAACGHELVARLLEVL